MILGNYSFGTPLGCFARTTSSYLTRLNFYASEEHETSTQQGKRINVRVYFQQYFFCQGHFVDVAMVLKRFLQLPVV